ncbi:type II secretion system F family protein [Glaciibacter sp. 2TAF33]|uniref:type II secretion system F family protein n=1 Tax=Glaciibacter sp. 2TAF33 TaxID=3233015 RepID=UPI003F8F411C
MTVMLGCLLGAGLLLVVSPLLWPVERRPASVRPRLRDRLKARLVQAGLGQLPLSAFIVISAIVAVAAAALTQAVLAIQPLTVVALVSGLLLPSLLVAWRAQARRRANRTVWPDVVDHLVAAVRSGLALPDSVSSLSLSGPVATRAAFAQFEREYRSTGSFGHSLDQLKAALADPIADRILETLRMAREVGGSDLTVVLRSLAAWLRQDTAIRQEVEARQSWVVNAAKLGVAAPWIVLLLLASRPEAALAYNTPPGTVVIVGGLAVSVIAYRVMIALGRFPEERRWFE